MKDFTEIMLCPEAVERSEVGLGQGCHPMGLHSAAPHSATHHCFRAD